MGSRSQPATGPGPQQAPVCPGWHHPPCPSPASVVLVAGASQAGSQGAGPASPHLPADCVSGVSGGFPARTWPSTEPPARFLSAQQGHTWG